MPKTAIVDIKERFCSIAVFDQGWKETAFIGSSLLQGSFLEKSSGTAEKVKAEIDRLAPEGCLVALLVPRSLVQVMSLELPAKNEALLNKMMHFEVTRRFPIQSTHLIYDYFIVDRRGENFVIDLAGFKREDFDEYFKTARDAGIYPDVVSLSSAASIPPEPQEGGTGKRTFIEVSPEGFEMSMVDGHRLVYSRFNRFKPKIEHDYFFRRGVIGESMTGRIADAISEELNHVRLVSGIEHIGSYLEKVYLAGGGVLHIGIKNSLSQNSGFSGSRIDSIQAQNDETGFGHVARAFGAAGLERKFLFNFIPPELRRKSAGDEKRKLKMYGIAILALVCVWLASSYFASWSTLRNLKSDLKRLKAEAFSVEDTQIRINRYKSYFDTFQKFSTSHSFTLDVLEGLTKLLPRQTYLREIDIRKNSILISGTSSDASSLLKILESSKLFKSVRFTAAIKTEGGKEKFKIGMEYE